MQCPQGCKVVRLLVERSPRRYIRSDTWCIEGCMKVHGGGGARKHVCGASERREVVTLMRTILGSLHCDAVRLAGVDEQISL